VFCGIGDPRRGRPMCLPWTHVSALDPCVCLGPMCLPKTMCPQRTSMANTQLSPPRHRGADLCVCPGPMCLQRTSRANTQVRPYKFWPLDMNKPRPKRPWLVFAHIFLCNRLYCMCNVVRYMCIPVLRRSIWRVAWFAYAAAGDRKGRH